MNLVSRTGHLLLSLTLLVGGASGIVHAELSSGLVQPAALHNIPRAGGECRRDAIDAMPAAAVEGPAADLSCALPAAEAAKEVGDPAALFVDVRRMADFEAFHIAGAVNIRPDELRSKPYWRGKRVVLVGNGKAERELYALCSGLKQAAYGQVRVLRGGMPAWLAQELPVQGKAPAVSGLTRLSAAELWAESQYTANLLLLDPRQNALQGDISYAVLLSRLTPEMVHSTLLQRRKQLKGVGLASVVLVAGTDTPEPQIEALRKALTPVPLLVYSDTAAAYRQQLQAQKAVWSARLRGPKPLPCGG